MSHFTYTQCLHVCVCWHNCLYCQCSEIEPHYSISLLTEPCANCVNNKLTPSWQHITKKYCELEH